MKAVFALTSTLFLTLAVCLSAMAADARQEKQKVVDHINYDGGADSKVVPRGNGPGLLKSTKDNEALQTAVAFPKSRSVGFQVCNNTLKGRKISYSNDLFDVGEDDIIPSGVAEPSRLQQMGYTYIKP